MRSVFHSMLLVVTLLIGLSGALLVPLLIDPDLGVIYSRDLLVMVGLLMFLGRGAGGSVLRWTVTMAWAVVVLFELVRAIGISAMTQQPLLYDAFFLAKHLYVLLSDLMGWKAPAMFAGIIVFWLVVAAAGHGLFGYLVVATGRWSGRQRMGFFGILVGAVLAGEQATPLIGNNSLYDASRNLSDSLDVLSDIQQGTDPSAYEEMDAVKLTTKPSVHIYIIESYGSGVLAKQIRDEYFSVRARMSLRLGMKGWSVVTSRTVAPVMGGRSWLADATLLSGRLVKYESVYRHLKPQFAALRTLPRFFETQGYRTVLMRQNNKVRPGVSLENNFAFSDTVFFDDIGYTGEPYGWAEVPDQVALGHLRDEVLPKLESEPTFVFAHLGSSHIPWTGLPPLVDDWRTMNTGAVVAEGEDLEMSKGQLKMQMKRFKRKDEIRLRRLRPTADNVEDYLEAITYSFEAVVRHIERLEQEPEIIIVMGDHQPPLYRKNTDFTVPMHVMAKDTRWLEAFREQGFKSGMKLGYKADAIRHEGFYSLMVRAMAGPNGAELPPYRQHGIGPNEAAGE